MDCGSWQACEKWGEIEREKEMSATFVYDARTGIKTVFYGLPFKFDDGGRKAAGFKGRTGDCVARAVAIATTMPYQEVYDRLAHETGMQRRSKRTGKRRASASEGISTRRKWFIDYMTQLGWEWVATMRIGSGCKVHLRPGELPMGRLVVAVSKHYCAVIDGVVHDTHDCTRGGMRCVYGYYKRIGT
jgi:hypothetical protein